MKDDWLLDGRKIPDEVIDIIGNLILNNKFRSVLYPLQASLSLINNYRKLTSLTPLKRATGNT